ncbi:MAG: diguanylate cyclase domain-containing protein [Pseudomonas sp.]
MSEGGLGGNLALQMDELTQALASARGEAWFHRLADGLPLIVWTADASGQIDYRNARCREYLSPQASDQALDWAAILHPDDLPRCRERWQQALASGEAYEVEYRFLRHADATYRWHLGQGIPVRDDSGRIIKWMGTCTDIDDQRRALETLLSAQTRLQEQVLERTALIERVNTHLLSEVQKGEHLLRQLESHTENLGRIIATQTRLAEAELDLELFLDLVVQQMQELTPATGAVVELVEGEEMVYRAACGSVASYVGLRLAIGTSLSGLCVRSGTVLMSPDTSQDPRVDQSACRKIGVQSMVVAPLLLSGKAVGVLKIMADQANVFSATDVQTLQLMAGLLGSELGHQVDYQRNQQLLAERTEEVAKRKESEAILRANMERTQRIIESSHEAFICIDVQGRITDWNSEASRIFGWNRGEVLGLSLARVIIPPRMRSAHAEGMARFRRTGQGVVINRRTELPALRKDGTELIVEITISASGSGVEHEFSAFMRDVTERKRIEQEVQLNQQLLRSLTDAIPALVAFIDTRQVLRYCNKPFWQSFAHEGGEILGKPLLELLGVTAYTAIHGYVDEALAGRQSSFEQALRTQDSERYMEARYVPELDIAGVVKGFYLILWDITERWAQEQHLRLRAMRDSLTGLYNRASILETLECAITEHLGGPRTLALLYLDVDRFKQINDSLGHAVGDEVLKAFAQRLERCVRGSDVVARLGGDEFVILLQQLASAGHACEVADKIIDSMAEPLEVRGHALQISTSIGVALLGGQANSSETLLEKADLALYQAKQAGRNRFSLSS